MGIDWLYLAAALVACAGVVSAALALLAVGALRRAQGRVTEAVRDLRRHPGIGDLPAASDPALRDLVGELNPLLADLRARARDAGAPASGLALLSGGPPDVALVGLDADWRVIAFSRGAARVTGWEPVEILDGHVEALFAPGEWERLLPKLARRSLRAAGIVDTVRLQRRDRAVYPAQVSIAAATEGDEGGALLLVARDLSAERALEDRLRESEERHRRVLEGLSDGVFIVQNDRLAYANRALPRLLGVEPAALGGRPFKDLIAARDLLRVLEALQEIAGGVRAEGEITCVMLAPGGAPIEARIAWAATEFQSRRAVAGTVTDIGARARHERALQASEARLQATVHSTGDGILVLERDPTGALAVTVANPAFRALSGIDDPRALGAAGLLAALRARTAAPDALASALDDAASGRTVAFHDLEVKGDRRAVIDLSAGPVRSPAGDTIGAIITLRDVTARVDGEAEVRRSLGDLSRAKSELDVAYRDLADAQKALAQRNAQLETLNAELKTLDEMKSSLLANVSHELHTPLVSIKGYTEMILKRKLGPLTPEQERGLGVALKNIDRLIEMIDNLLSFSRMEQGETRLQLEDVPFWQMVDEAVEMIGERVQKKNLAVTTQYETDELVVRCDRVKIGQVLTNLLTNAVKFNQEGGRITLTARKGPKGFLEVDVADTGIGIPAEAQEKIFERFYQVDGTPRRRYEGTGIGLSIARDILRLHGCSIRVSSEPGRGSIFTITLPLAHEPQPAPAPPRPGRARARES